MRKVNRKVRPVMRKSKESKRKTIEGQKDVSRKYEERHKKK